MAAAICARMYETAFAWPIFPEERAHRVTAGLKCPPEILPPRPTARANAATIKTGVPVNEMDPIKRAVPKNSTKVGENICKTY